MVRMGQRLFSVRQGTRRIHFLSPVSGRVAHLNRGLGKMASELDATPYHNHWVCTVEAENLDAEIHQGAFALYAFGDRPVFSHRRCAL